jgi:hypothetical protein
MWETKILRRMHGSVAEQGIWRIRTNPELRELYNDLDIIVDIKRKIGMDWTRSKLNQGRIVKKIFERKPEGSKEGEDRE